MAVDGWAAEESKYNYAKEKFTEAAGHYTQLVWEATTSVGCGAVNCSNSAENGANGWFLVCEYSPRGNVNGEFGLNVRKAGEATDGEPGLGSAWRLSGVSGVLVALVAASSLMTVYV